MPFFLEAVDSWICFVLAHDSTKVTESKITVNRITVHFFHDPENNVSTKNDNITFFGNPRISRQQHVIFLLIVSFPFFVVDNIFLG